MRYTRTFVLPALSPLPCFPRLSRRDGRLDSPSSSPLINLSLRGGCWGSPHRDELIRRVILPVHLRLLDSSSELSGNRYTSPLRFALSRSCPVCGYDHTLAPGLYLSDTARIWLIVLWRPFFFFPPLDVIALVLPGSTEVQPPLFTVWLLRCSAPTSVFYGQMMWSPWEKTPGALSGFQTGGNSFSSVNLWTDARSLFMRLSWQNMLVMD